MNGMSFRLNLIPAFVKLMEDLFCRRKLAMLEELSDEQLSEDFLDDTTHFTTFVYNECQPKTTLNATPMSCYSKYI